MSANPRKLSSQIVYNVLKNRTNLSGELSGCRMESGLNNLDLRFITELTTGTIRNLGYIDYVISCASSIKLNKISPFVLSVLRTGAYQILFMDKIPHSAAVNESVKIIKNSKNSRLSGFVNAVLRRISENGKDVSLPTEEFERLCVLYSCPGWIAQLWQKDVGCELPDLVKAMNEKPGTILRANTLKTDSTKLTDILQSEGWICRQYKSPVFPEIDYLVLADKISDISSSQAFKEGMFYVQDAAGAFVSEVLDPKPGSVVFDMCAAPGGKTTHLAEKMNNQGKIYAFDVTEEKISLITENASRLGIDIISAGVSDSTSADPVYFEKADYILVDAPCSGLGIIRKKPDIKYIRKPEDIRSLSRISMDILNTAAKYLKPGGTMVFSTCTTTKEENTDTLFDFLKAHPEFHLEKIPCSKDNNGYITLYPHRDDCDGFFISYLKKE